MIDPISEAFIVPELVAGSMLLVWYLSDRFEGLRKLIRHSYAQPYARVFAARTLFVSAPMWGIPGALFVLTLLLPPPASAWGLVALFVWLCVALPLAHRVPPPFAPKWLLDEFRNGRTTLERPDGGWDRGCLWVAVTASALGAVSGMLLIVLFRAAG